MIIEQLISQFGKTFTQRFVDSAEKKIKKHPHNKNRAKAFDTFDADYEAIRYTPYEFIYGTRTMDEGTDYDKVISYDGSYSKKEREVIDAKNAKLNLDLYPTHTFRSWEHDFFSAVTNYLASVTVTNEKLKLINYFIELVTKKCNQYSAVDVRCIFLKSVLDKLNKQKVVVLDIQSILDAPEEDAIVLNTNQEQTAKLLSLLIQKGVIELPNSTSNNIPAEELYARFKKYFQPVDGNYNNLPTKMRKHKDNFSSSDSLDDLLKKFKL